VAARNIMQKKVSPSVDDEDACITPVLSSFDELIPYHLRIAQEASFQAITQAVGKPKFKPGWYTILTILSANPGATPTELSKLCGRDRSTLTSTLAGLHARGLIARRPKADDQRSYGVRLTAAGESMLKKLRVIAHAHDAKLDQIVGEHKPLFLTLLRRIVDELGNSTPPPRSGQSSRRSE